MQGSEAEGNYSNVPDMFNRSSTAVATNNRTKTVMAIRAAIVVGVSLRPWGEVPARTGRTFAPSLVELTLVQHRHPSRDLGFLPDQDPGWGGHRRYALHRWSRGARYTLTPHTPLR